MTPQAESLPPALAAAASPTARRGSAPRPRDAGAPLARDRASWGEYAVVLAVYALVLLLTRTPFIGDTPDYVDSVVAWFQHRQLEFWEFGHLLWRPLGALVVALGRALHVGGVAAAVDSPAFRVGVFHALLAMNYVAGAVSLTALVAWLRRLGLPRAPVLASAVLMIGANAFLMFTQTGLAYVPALSLLLVGLWAVARRDDEAHPVATMATAALAFAGSVLFWVPMVLAVPAGACIAAIMRGPSATRRLIVLGTWAGSGLVTILVYLVVVGHLGLHDAAAVGGWVAAASHGIQNGGASRAVFGLAQSVLRMDRLGIVAKRHLLGDPLNPASTVDVIAAGLARIAAFYVVLAIGLLVLLRRPVGRRVLVFLILTFIPVFAFAVHWQGGDPERYLALFPALFLVIATALSLVGTPARSVATALLLASILVGNVPPLWRPRTARACAAITHRLDAATPPDGAPALVVTPHALDEITSARGLCFDSPVVASGHVAVVGLVMANSGDVPSWRQRFARSALDALERHEPVYVSVRAFAPRPPADWRWAEGDDPRIHWRDFPAFFSTLDFGPPVGGTDGFVELRSTPRTLAALRSWS